MVKSYYNAPALDKGLDIIELLALSAEPLTQAQIASHLNKTVNEIYRMLNTLKQRGYLEFNEKTDQYHLSYKLLTLVSSFSPIKTLIEKALPAMREITTKTNHSIHLSIYTAGKLLVIAQQDSPSAFNYHVAVGATFDLLETSSGRVLLTFQTEQERKRRLDRRKLFMKISKERNVTKTKIKEIEKQYTKKTIHKIKKDGCEIVKSLQIEGVTNISYPIYDNSCYAIAALTTPFIRRLYEKTSVKDTSETLKFYSIKLSKELGYVC
tara:strand:- start:2898 stop:3695 length:798 start_codon:yes stop_codon:yes gene_type:complete